MPAPPTPPTGRPGRRPAAPAGRAPPVVPAVHLDPPHRGKVLVVSPHPDDESIGPGGTLAKHARLGDPVTVVFVTSGVHGDARRRYDPERYVARRRAEAQAAAAVLGLAGTEFWPYPDSTEPSPDDLENLTGLLADALYRHLPDVLYVPHPGEVHGDHHACATTTLAAVERTACAAAVLGYEVWSPLDAELVVDVSDTYELKLAAIRRYESQLEEGDILGPVEGLNRFRSCLLPHQGRYAEAFRRLG